MVVTRQSKTERQRAPAAMCKVGLFGNLGTGNIGNDASMESVLRFLREQHPDADIDVMSGGAAAVTERYGLPAVPMFWHQGGSTPASMPLKVAGKAIDVIRTARWVHRHDVVIVPGMGVLEASLPLRPWGFPYALFLLSTFGRVFGTKVALVSVGAGRIKQPITRWLYNWAARLAWYRSYRNVGSRDAMRDSGLDTSADHVYPDLAFGIPVAPCEPGDANTVCVGVMAYRGSNDDRARASAIYGAYIATMKSFVRWLVDDGRNVTLLIGDTNGSDGVAVQDILADLQKERPDINTNRVTAAEVATFADVLQAIRSAGSVVAIRFHNVLGALRLFRPTISIGYSAKHQALMTDMGLAEYCPSVYTLSLETLIEQFRELESRSAELQKVIAERDSVNQQLMSDQFAELSTALFTDAGRQRASAIRSRKA